MSLPIKPPFAPMEALLVKAMPSGAHCSMSQSGTAFGALHSATAIQWSCNQNRVSLSGVIFRRSLKQLRRSKPGSLLLMVS